MFVVLGDPFHRQHWLSAADIGPIRPEWWQYDNVGVCGDGRPTNVEFVEWRTAAQQLDIR